MSKRMLYTIEYTVMYFIFLCAMQYLKIIDFGLSETCLLAFVSGVGFLTGYKQALKDAQEDAQEYKNQ